VKASKAEGRVFPFPFLREGRLLEGEGMHFAGVYEGNVQGCGRGGQMR